MSALGRLLFRVASVIAGPDRRDWIEAMEAEAASTDDNSTQWAIGCALAAARDRLAREWRFLLLVVLVPIGALVLEMAIFFPLAWLRQQHWISDWVFVGSALLVPLPFAFLIGRMRPGVLAYIGAAISFVIVTMVPLVVFWAKFGKSPFTWFGNDTTWFNMTPAAGLGCALAVWLVGAWLGSRTHRAST